MTACCQQKNLDMGNIQDRESVLLTCTRSRACRSSISKLALLSSAAANSCVTLSSILCRIRSCTTRNTDAEEIMFGFTIQRSSISVGFSVAANAAWHMCLATCKDGVVSTEIT